MYWTLAYRTTVITACTVVQDVLTVWTVTTLVPNLVVAGWGYGYNSKIMRATCHVPRTLNNVTATEM